LAGKSQELAGQVGGPGGKVHDQLQELSEGGAEFFFSEAKRGIALDAGEQIGELMGNAAGQGAHALHLLRLKQLTFHLLALADITVDADKMRQLPAQVHDRRHRERNFKQHAILATVVELPLPAGPAQHRLPKLSEEIWLMSATLENAWRLTEQ